MADSAIATPNGNEPRLGGDLKLPEWGASSFYVLEFSTALNLLAVAAIIQPGHITRHITDNRIHHYLYIETISDCYCQRYEELGVYGYQFHVDGKLFLTHTPLVALEGKFHDLDLVATVLNLAPRFQRRFGDTYFWSGR